MLFYVNEAKKSLQKTAHSLENDADNDDGVPPSHKSLRGLLQKLEKLKRNNRRISRQN